MKLFYDCETSGLPDFKAPSEAPHQPYIIQLAAILKADDGEEVATFNRFIMPYVGFKLDPKITELTGITQEDLETKGEDMGAVMGDFIALNDVRATIKVYSKLTVHNRIAQA